MATACAFAGDGQTLLSCGDDQALKRLDVEELVGEPVAALEGYPTDMAFCPSVSDKQSSDTAAVCCSDGTFCLISCSTGREEKRVQAYTAGAAIALAWNLEGTALATGGEDGVVKIWSRVGMLRSTVATMSHPVYCICWGRNDALLFSSGKLLTIEQKQQKQIQWKAHDSTILAVDWNPVNHLIVSGGEDCKYRVWDAFGRQLFVSAPLEHVTTALAWAPNGATFAVGSFNALKVCDRTGWTVCREDLQDTGSVLKLAWSADGTLVAGACAGGAVAIAEVANQAIEWKHIRATILDSKQVEVHDCLEDTTDVLPFRDRIVDASLANGTLLVQTAACQVHVYSVTDLQSPTVVDVPSARSSVLIQSPKHLLAGWAVYSLEGRRVAPVQCFSGINTNVLDRDALALNDMFLAVLENSRDAIRLIDLAKGKPVALIKHKLPIVQLALGEDDLLAFVDSNGDLFVQATGKRTFKLPCTMVESISFNEAGALVAAVDGGNKLQVFFYPGVVWVDPDLLGESSVEQDTPHLASKQPKILSFADNLVTIREHSGSNLTSSFSRYPALLHDLIKARKWEDAIRLCRFVDQRFLWAILAGKALDRCHLDSAEIGLASLQSVAKLNYILYIKDLPNEKARVAELALFKRDVKSAEAVLLQCNPPMLYRAIKINLRMHRWDRARQIAKAKPELARMVELYYKQWTSQEILSGKEAKELKAIKAKFSDKPQDSDDEDAGEAEEEDKPAPASRGDKRTPAESKHADDHAGGESGGRHREDAAREKAEQDADDDDDEEEDDDVDGAGGESKE